MLAEKLGVDLPKQGFGLPMRWRSEEEKQEVKILWRSAHRSWREFVCLQRDKTVARIFGNNLESCLACCGILETFQKYSKNIPQISEKYWGFVRKNAESCVVCFATRCSKEEYQRLSSGGATALFYISTSILNKRPFNLKLACIVHLHYIWIPKLNKRPLKSLKMSTCYDQRRVLVKMERQHSFIFSAIKT